MRDSVEECAGEHVSRAVCIDRLRRIAGHPLQGLAVVDERALGAESYDKRFCMGRELPYYTPGDHFVTFDINGIKCALLICFDLRFPELYRQLKKQGVQCILQSFYNARQKGPSVHSDIMVPSMQCRAATNYFWVSMTNSSGWFSPYAGGFIRPDGRVVETLDDHKDGVIINTVDLSEEHYDPSAEFRDAAIEGALDNALSGLEDVRSGNRNIF